MEENEQCPAEGYLLVRIHIPELNIQKCLQFPRDQLIWDIKQQCLASIPKELNESFNYGLFSPPENGRAGKFLDEERRLGDYPFSGPVGYLELKYKRRVYKTIPLDEKQIKGLHTRANIKRFLDYVQNGQVEKIIKMCSKGLDPNYHCQDSGETPLTIATSIKNPEKALIALVNGGALLDYRTRDGSTAVHRSVENKNIEALKTLLELGASPNYKDSKGLTPLYLTITNNVDPQFTEILLRDHAATGAQDIQGWQEVHQACRTGMTLHLEHLLLYGADINARNASGNTPLHVCAVNNQHSCAKQLLAKGADRQALNYSNQNPHQVAVIADNMELAEVIQNYKQETKEENIDMVRSNRNNCPHSVNIVQEIKHRHSNLTGNSVKESRQHTASGRFATRRDHTPNHFATAPRQKKFYEDNETRMVVLHRGKKGFGFILRGAKATSPLMELTPSEKCPALQYLDDVDPGGVADMAGLKKGDFLIEINNEDVSSASHEHVVDLIKKSGDLVQMTVTRLESPKSSISLSKSAYIQTENYQSNTHRQYATLPRNVTNSCEVLTKSLQAPLPPRRDPRTTLSIGRARARSMIGGLGSEKERGSTESVPQATLSGTVNSTPTQPRTASIRQRPVSSRITSAELEELFQKQKENISNGCGVKVSTLVGNSGFQTTPKPKYSTRSRVYAKTLSRDGKLHREFHSSPDIAMEVSGLNSSKNHRSQEDLTRLPPPVYPPPPPPSLLSITKVELLRRKQVMEQNSSEQEGAVKGVASSFKPSSSAKLYTPPEDIKTVGYVSKCYISKSHQAWKSRNTKANNLSFKPTNSSTPQSNSNNINQYAQPLKTQNMQLGRGIGHSDESEKRDEDSKGSTESSHLLFTSQTTSMENSGNSNTSGSSSESSSLQLGYSVEEIRRGRSMLKCSKSYPEDFLRKRKDPKTTSVEDCDNSSSGVSSDQEIVSTVNDYSDRNVNSMTLPSTKTQQQHLGVLTRYAVSLAHLPPPLEDEKAEFCLPPPPEFEGINNIIQHSDEAVLDPPPQFSDEQQVTKSRILKRSPKTATKNK